MRQKTFVMNENSKGLTIDYNGVPGSTGAFPRIPTGLPSFSLKKSMELIRKDAFIKGSVNTLVDKVLESGFRVEGERAKELQELLDENKMELLLESVIYNLIIYNNAFIENKTVNGKYFLNLLETQFMKITAKDNGDIVQFYQDNAVSAVSKNYPRWNPDKVTFIKYRPTTTSIWSSPSDFEALYQVALIKDSIKQWLHWFFSTNQLRSGFNIKNANDARVKDFLSSVKASEARKDLPFAVGGEIEHFILNKFEYGDRILDVLNWCDNQFIVLLQIPPIAVGMPDSSGRSNSVEQYQALNTTVNRIHKLLETYMTQDLFPKIGFEGHKFIFGVLDNGTRMKALDMAEKMRNIRMSDEAIQEFLESQGLKFTTKKLFTDLEELQGISNDKVPQGSEGQLGKKSQDDAPSRKGQSDGEISKANQKTMVKNSFDGYPYTYEVLQE